MGYWNSAPEQHKFSWVWKCTSLVLKNKHFTDLVKWKLCVLGSGSVVDKQNAWLICHIVFHPKWDFLLSNGEVNIYFLSVLYWGKALSLAQMFFLDPVNMADSIWFLFTDAQMSVLTLSFTCPLKKMYSEQTNITALPRSTQGLFTWNRFLIFPS